MKKQVFVFITVAVVAVAIVLVLLLQRSNEPCVFLKKVTFGMSKTLVEKEVGSADGSSASEVSDETWYTYQTTYEGVPVEVTLTYLRKGSSENLIGISLQTDAPMDSEMAASVAKKMVQQIRNAYQDRNGYYETSENHILKLGVEEGATGIFFTIEQKESAIWAKGRRLS